MLKTANFFFFFKVEWQKISFRKMWLWKVGYKIFSRSKGLTSNRKLKLFLKWSLTTKRLRRSRGVWYDPLRNYGYIRGKAWAIAHGLKLKTRHSKKDNVISFLLIIVWNKIFFNEAVKLIWDQFEKEVILIGLLYGSKQK